MHILGDAAFTCKPITQQNGECGTVAACDVLGDNIKTRAKVIG